MYECILQSLQNISIIINLICSKQKICESIRGSEGALEGLYRGSMKEIEKNPDLGPGGAGRGTFIVSFFKRVARKLRRIILLHIVLGTFSITLSKSQKLITFMIFGPGGRDHGPRSHYS